MIKCKETFEQGTPRGAGGCIKLVAGREYPAEKNEYGFVITIDLAKRTVPEALVNRWAAAGLVEIDG